MRSRRSWPLIALLGVVTAAAGCGEPDPRVAEFGAAATAATPTIAATTPPSFDGPGAIITGALPVVEDMNQLVWVSDWIVQGTVVEALPAQWYRPAVDPAGRPVSSPDYTGGVIYTEYVVAVEQVFRGRPTTTLTVRRVGGTVDGFTMHNATTPELHVGDHLVLFLGKVPEQEGEPLTLAHDREGYWRVDGNRVVPLSGYEAMPLAELRRQIAEALRQGPPDKPLGELVPLSEAPAGPDLPAVGP